MLRVVSWVSSPRAWAAWLTAAAVTVGIHGLTLSYFPPIWQDEVQIIEYGRAVAQPAERDWSVNWRLTGRPVLVPYYLGPLSQELAFRVTGGRTTGPRASALLGAILASAAMMGWLLARGAAPVFALICSLVLLWDPVFTQSYRGARLEGWVFAWIFTSCWCIRLALNERAGTRRRRDASYAAGACLTLAGLFWASAVLLLPLVGYELLSPLRAGLARDSLKHVFTVSGGVMAGAVSVACIALLPVWTTSTALLRDLTSVVSDAAMAPSVSEATMAILACFKSSRVILVLGIAAFVAPRGRWLGLCCLIAAVSVALTTPYTHRVVYLVPYLVLGLAILAESTFASPLAVTGHRLITTGLILAVTWAPLQTLVVGGYTRGPLLRREALSPDRITEVAREAIGAGPMRVYLSLGAYEFYYAGRTLGWKMYAPHDGIDGPDRDRLNELIATMDFVIVPEKGPATDQELQFLQQHGFHLAKTLVAGRGRRSQNSAREPSPGNGRGYGTYLLMVRDAPGGA